MKNVENCTLPPTALRCRGHSRKGTHLFKRCKELDTHITQLVPSHMLEQEGVLLQVLIREIELDLLYQFSDQFLVWWPPLLLLLLPFILTSTGWGTTKERRKDRA